MQIIEVKNKQDIKDFHLVPKIVYKNDKNWVCQLEPEIENIFFAKYQCIF